MEISDDYTRENDRMMFELHEARHEIMERILEVGAEKVNDEAKAFFEEWKKRRKTNPKSA